MRKPSIRWTRYLLATILVIGFALGVFFFKVLFRGAAIDSEGLLMGAILGVVLSGLFTRLKRPFFLPVSFIALGILWFALPWNSAAAPVAFGCGCLCGIGSIPCVASRLSVILPSEK